MPPVGPVYQMTYEFLVEGQTCENVIHFRSITGSETPAQIRTSAEFYLATVKGLISNEVTFPAIVIKQMTPIAFDETVAAPVTNTAGTRSQPPINNTLALVVTKRTGVAGKTHRGRIYLPGIAADDADNIGLNTGGMATAITTFNNLLATFGPSGTDLNLQIGIYSRSIGGFNPFTTAGWQAITGFTVQPVFGNQRRRRIGVGI